MASEVQYITEESNVLPLVSLKNPHYQGIEVDTNIVASDKFGLAALWAGAHGGGWLVKGLKKPIATRKTEVLPRETQILDSYETFVDDPNATLIEEPKVNQTYAPKIAFERVNRGEDGFVILPKLNLSPEERILEKLERAQRAYELESISEYTNQEVAELDLETADVYELQDILESENEVTAYETPVEVPGVDYSDEKVHASYLVETQFVDSLREDLMKQKYSNDFNRLMNEQNENFDNWSDSEISTLYDSYDDEYNISVAEFREDYVKSKGVSRRLRARERRESAITDSLVDMVQSENEEKSLTQEYYEMLQEYDALTSWEDAKKDDDFKRMYWRERKWIQRNKISDEYERIAEEYGHDMLEAQWSKNSVYTVFGKVPEAEATA